MVNDRSKLSLDERVRPRTAVAHRRRSASDDALVYFGSVAFAVAAMVLAALTTFVG